MKNVAMIVLIWVIIGGMGLGLAEGYVRVQDGYNVFSIPLSKITHIPLDDIKIYNRVFYQNNPRYFEGWDKVDLFDATVPYPHYVYKPNSSAQNRHTNSLGMRGREPTGRQILIACIGASTTEGSYGDNETYPEYLYQYFEEKYPGIVDVVNAGHHAYSAESIHHYMRSHVLPLNPDVVIFYEAANNIGIHEFTDVMDSNWGGYKLWYHDHSLVYQALWDNSALFKRLAYPSRPPSPLKHKFEDISPKPGATTYQNILESIAMDVHASGAKMVFVSFVTIAHEGYVPAEGNKALYSEVYMKYFPFTPEEVETMYDFYNTRAWMAAVNTGSTYVDITNEFPKNESWFEYDYIHMNSEGSKKLAELIATNVELVIWP